MAYERIETKQQPKYSFAVLNRNKKCRKIFKLKNLLETSLA